MPVFHIISLIFIVVNIIIYLGICGLHIYETYGQLNKYSFSINLSMNILERVPRIMELLLYPTITIVLNQTDLIAPTGHQSPYLEYFVIESIYYSEDLIATYFKKSLFGEILKDNLKLKYNLENYLYDNKYSLFKNVQLWERQLNKMGDFCINLALGQIETGEKNPLYSNFNNLYELMSSINDQAFMCKIQGQGMKDSGIKIEFNFILQEITTRYIEYIIHNRTTDDKLNQAMFNFILSEGLEKAFADINMYLVSYFNIIAYALRQDFEKQNNDMLIAQIIFYVLFLLINVEIIISLIVIITKQEKYKKLLSFFVKIPKENDFDI